MNDCKNCGTHLSGNYCTNCGQKIITSRLNIKETLVNTFRSIFNFEKGFFFTVKELLLNRRGVIKGFIDGKRKKYYDPFRFMLLTGALSFFVSNSIDWFNKVEKVRDETPQKALNILFEQHPVTIFLFIIPFMSATSRLFFKSHKYNYSEHLVLNSFYIGLLSLIFVYIEFLKIVLGDINSLLFFLYSFSLPGIWLYTGFFKGNLIRLIFLSILSIFCGLFFFAFVAISFNNLISAL